jgi:hypothetical protein
LVGRVGMSDPGGETPGLALPFDADPCDDDTVEGVEGVTFERDRAPACRQNDDHRFALHGPTVAPRGVTSVTISSQGVSIARAENGAADDG